MRAANALSRLCGCAGLMEPPLLAPVISLKISCTGKRGSSVVRHLPLVLKVPGSIPARGEENFGVRTRFL